MLLHKSLGLIFNVTYINRISLYNVRNFRLTSCIMNTCIHKLHKYNAHACHTHCFHAFKDKFGKVRLRNLLLRPGVASFP